MKKIGTNLEILEYLFSNNLWILDSTIQEVNIRKRGFLIDVDVILELARTAKLLKLEFQDVHNFNFNSYAGYTFYNVEFCKFFVDGTNIYLALDPVDELENVNKDDNNCVQAKMVNGYITE